MEIWIALFFLVLTFLGDREGFDPFIPDSKPPGYPDQSDWGDLILAQKTIQNVLKTSTLDPSKRDMLSDLLNLLQFI